MSSLRRRLIAGFGANTFSRLSTTLIQIVGVPIFLTHWGTGLYGEWILLNTIPSYFSLSDIGFGSVAGNEMTMLVAAHKQDEALEVFQSVWMLLTGISIFVGLLLFAGVWLLPLSDWMHLRLLGAREVRLSILFLGLSVLLTMQEILFQAAFRCVGKYAFGTLSKSLITLTSFSGSLVGVVVGLRPSQIALIFLLVNGVGTIVLWRLLKKNIPWIRWGVDHANRSVIRRLFLPAISFMSFPIGNALTLQGSLFVIGSVLGPMAVVVFSTARTISRSVIQAMGLISNSVWPEMSAAFGSKNLGLARRLHSRSCQLSIMLCLCITFGALLFGNSIWKTWTVGKVATDPVLLNIMLFQMVISALWVTSSVVLMATNHHQGLARVILATAFFSLLLAWLLMRLFGLRGAAVALLLGDSVQAAYVLRTSLHVLEDKLSDFVRSMFQIYRFRKELPSGNAD